MRQLKNPDAKDSHINKTLVSKHSCYMIPHDFLTMWREQVEMKRNV